MLPVTKERIRETKEGRQDLIKMKVSVSSIKRILASAEKAIRKGGIALAACECNLIEDSTLKTELYLTYEAMKKALELVEDEIKCLFSQ